MKEKIIAMLKKMVAAITACWSAIWLKAAYASATATTGSGSITNSKLVTGTVDLLNDVTRVIQILSAAATIVLEGIQFFKLQNATEHEEPAIKKRMITILVGGVGILLVSTLVNVIMGYYK